MSAASDVLLYAAGGVLGLAAVLVLLRMTLGPTMLDRAISFDVLATVSVGVIAVDAALRRNAENLPLLLVITLLGFVGSVSVARFSPGSDDLQAAEDDEARDHERRGGTP